MIVTLKPEFEKYIEEQVKAGWFRSLQEVLEAGIARLMLDPTPPELDDEDIKRLQKSIAEADRGEVIDAEELHAQIRRKYNIQK